MPAHGYECISATLQHHRYMLRGCTEPQAPSSALLEGTSFRSPCAYTFAPSFHPLMHPRRDKLTDVVEFCPNQAEILNQSVQLQIPIHPDEACKSKADGAASHLPFPNELLHMSMQYMHAIRCKSKEGRWWNLYHVVSCTTFQGPVSKNSCTLSHGPWSLQEHVFSSFAFRHRANQTDRSSTDSIHTERYVASESSGSAGFEHPVKQDSLTIMKAHGPATVLQFCSLLILVRLSTCCVERYVTY